MADQYMGGTDNKNDITERRIVDYPDLHRVADFL
jgi:hypothetical protein